MYFKKNKLFGNLLFLLFILVLLTFGCVSEQNSNVVAKIDDSQEIVDLLSDNIFRIALINVNEESLNEEHKESWDKIFNNISVQLSDENNIEVIYNKQINIELGEIYSECFNSDEYNFYNLIHTAIKKYQLDRIIIFNIKPEISNFLPDYIFNLIDNKIDIDVYNQLNPSFQSDFIPDEQNSLNTFTLRVVYFETFFGASFSNNFLISSFQEIFLDLIFNNIQKSINEALDYSEIQFLEKIGLKISDERLYKKDSFGLTPFLRAAISGKIDIIYYLMDESEYFYVNDITYNGMSALMLASKTGHLDVVELLMENGAYPELISDENKTALMYAEENNHKEIAAILKEIDTPESPIDPTMLVSEWAGNNSDGSNIKLTIELIDNRLKGNALIHYGLSEKEKQDAYNGTLKGFPDNVYDSRFLVEQKFDIYLKNETVLFIGRELNVIWQKVNESGRWLFPIFTVSLSSILHDDGFITGEVETKENVFFYLQKPENAIKELPSEIEKGETIQLTCIDFPEYHYNIYVPAIYDPANAIGVIIFDNAVGNALPRRVETAEDIGYISIGLVESGNNIDDSELCNYAVIQDLKRRFNIHPEKFIFAGFSGGGDRSNIRAIDYIDSVQGVICIGISSMRAAEKGVTVLYIMGERDAVWT